MNRLFLLPLLPPLSAYAQTEVSDSTKTQELREVVVEASLANTSAKKTTYIPTSRQKHASQTGSELLNRMAISQLKITDGDNIETASGQAVAIYINFLPASQNDLTTMRTADVKGVDYLDYPSEPRFQGNAHVVNFIMQQYEYGGYVKAYANENFNYNSGQLNLYSKLQYKRMTYDIGVAESYASPNHGGSDKKSHSRLNLSGFLYICTIKNKKNNGNK